MLDVVGVCCLVLLAGVLGIVGCWVIVVIVVGCVIGFSGVGYWISLVLLLVFFGVVLVVCLQFWFLVLGFECFWLLMV